MVARLAYSACETVLATDPTRVLKAGDTMTGGLTMTNVAITLTGASGNVVGNSSMTASAFFGDGANLTALNATQLTSGTLPMARIATGDIDTTKLKTGSVDTNRLNNDAVTALKILDLNVTTQKLAANAVDTTKLGSGSVGQSQLQASAVNTNNIVAAAVDTTKILAGSVDTNRLSRDAVTTEKILFGAVDTSKILLGAVDTNRLGNSSVTNAKILEGAVDTKKMAVTGVAAGSYASPASVSVDISGRITAISAGSGAAGSVVVSSFTLVPISYAETQTACNVCVPGSTITVTMNGSVDALVFWSASCIHGTNGAQKFFNVLEDGLYMDAFDGTTVGAMHYETALVANERENCSFTARVKPRSAASHSYCLCAATNTGTLTLPGNAKGHFGVREN